MSKGGSVLVSVKGDGQVNFFTPPKRANSQFKMRPPIRIDSDSKSFETMEENAYIY